jgi:hypothetical protein
LVAAPVLVASLVAAGSAPFPAFAAVFDPAAGFVAADFVAAVFRSLAAREARPGSVTLGIRIRGISGMGAS